MELFVLRLERGGPWDWSIDMREQDGWDEHAAFMDDLVEKGSIILGGPLEDKRFTMPPDGLVVFTIAKVLAGHEPVKAAKGTIHAVTAISSRHEVASAFAIRVLACSPVSRKTNPSMM